MDQPNEVGDWIQISILGSGAFGTVMLWRNQKNSDFIAIKKCKFQKAGALSAKQKERWHMEVDFLKSIDHQNIISYKRLDPVLAEMINKYNPTKLPLLPMEYCRKGNLRRYLTSEPIKLCGLPEHDVRDILEDISNGLKYLHTKKITHRDIKPDNVVLQHCDNRKGETTYKIIDLGYAKELQDATLSFVGTLHYLAPEIFYNDDYGHSVDYWSVGIMVFEIICGSLPFLPELTPYERYEKIKDKGAEDICIYVSYSGAVTNSTKIKRENFISSSFKQNIEAWLKRVLQMNPANRTFTNDLSPFDYLRFILDRKIIQVFSVFKLEFYSYEVNNSTLLGTLKDWISRDIKVLKNDLLFLFRRQRNNMESKDGREEIWYCNDDNTLLECLNCDDEVILYVYRKDALFCENNPNPKMPNLVKELFVNSNFQIKFAKHVYRQALFYVYNELHTTVESKYAYSCLIQYIEDLCEKIKNKYVTATSEFGTLLSKVEQFLRKKKNAGLMLNKGIDLSAYPELAECLKYFERLVSNVERREINLKDFGKQFKVLEGNKQGISDAHKKILKIFEKYDIQSQFDKINGKGFWEKSKDGETHETVLKRIHDVVSETLKLKYNLFVKEKELKNYSNDFYMLLKRSEELLSWVEDFISNVQNLSTDFGVTEDRHDKIVTEAVKSARRDFILNLDMVDSEKIIKENELLRCQVADLLSEKVAAHKNFVDESGSYFDLN